MPSSQVSQQLARLKKKKQLVDKAPYVDEYQYLIEFEKCMKANSKDLQLAYCGKNSIVWSNLTCTKCLLDFETSRRFLEHVLQCQFTEADTYGYWKYGIVSNEVQEVINDAQSTRTESSYYSMKIVNEEELKLLVRMTSPLATYLIRGITVHMTCPTVEKKPVWPLGKRMAVYTKIRKGRTNYFVLFSTKALAQRYKEAETKKNEKKQKLLKKKLRAVKLTIPDVVLHPSSRSAEATRDLIKALGLPENSNPSQATIVKEVKKQFNCKRRRKPKVKSKSKPTGVLTAINGVKKTRTQSKSRKRKSDLFTSGRSTRNAATAPEAV